MKTASWIVVDKATRQPILETFSERVAAAINRERYEVIPILEYLQNFNRAITVAERDRDVETVEPLVFGPPSKLRIS